MAATIGRTLLAGLLLSAGAALLASPITPESATSPDSSTAVLKEPAVSFSTPGTAAIQPCLAGCADEDMAAIPEPAALFLLGTGVVLLTTHRRRRRQTRR